MTSCNSDAPWGTRLCFTFLETSNQYLLGPRLSWVLQHLKGLLGLAKKSCFTSKLLNAFDLNWTKLYFHKCPTAHLALARLHWRAFLGMKMTTWANRTNSMYHRIGYGLINFSGPDITSIKCWMSKIPLFSHFLGRDSLKNYCLLCTYIKIVFSITSKFDNL